jgi:MerR family transcriptional regulator, redox-sensitive transcriptional activator SoxR
MKVEVSFMSRMLEMLSSDLLTVGEVAHRSGFAPSALRFYERLGLLAASRTAGGQRRYQRNVLRRLAFIRAARNVGLSLEEVAAALATLPEGRTPTRSDWTRLSRGWRTRLDEQIRALSALRDGLESCIGCGCLSLKRCAISNPGDVASTTGTGAQYLPAALRAGAGAGDTQAGPGAVARSSTSAP